ncbi:MAG TPA: hypothetical protein GX708_02340 [Gallicola sp.]|nr:hypothetical protein [Gallicola sp.]
MKLYESIKRPDNYDKFKIPFKKGDLITIQEKIDGSNTTIFNDNGTLRLFSRTQEITDSKENFQDFIKFVKEHENDILNNLPNQYAMFGEWLGQAKIPYNKKAKSGVISPYYVFDIAYKIENMNDEDKIQRYYLTPKESKKLATNMLLNFVPIIENEIVLNNFDELIGKYVENQKSLIDEESIREGIVVKTTDGTKRVKIVATQFSEVKYKKNKLSDNPYNWLERFITPMRIQKFLIKVKELENKEELKVEDYKLIFSKLDLLSGDVIREELELIKEDINKIIKKQSVNLIKQFLENEEGKK